MTETTNQLDAHDAKPPVRTVADVLREMPIGQRFRRPNWIAQGWCEKQSQGEFLWCDFTKSDMSGFSMSDSPHDDPEYGIILLPAAEPVEQPAGVVDGDDMRKRYVARLEQIQKLMKDNEKLRVIAGEFHDELQRLKRPESEQPAGVVVTRELIERAIDSAAVAVVACKNLGNETTDFADIAAAYFARATKAQSVVTELRDILAADARRKAGG